MSYIDEFKQFISRGNVLDMAVGVIVGGAFTGIVNSLVDNIINPAITLITGGSGTEVGGLNFNGIDLGAFISAIINFLIIAFVLFNVVKAINKMQEAVKKEEPAEEPAPAPTCPHCLEEVKEGATRCPHCGGEI